jgi:hypothetical protein
MTPNGSGEFRDKDPGAFKQLWGRVHPNYLNEEFYRDAFRSKPLLLASSPYDLERIKAWRKDSTLQLSLAGSELLAVAVLNP